MVSCIDMHMRRHRSWVVKPSSPIDLITYVAAVRQRKVPDWLAFYIGTIRRYLVPPTPSTKVIRHRKPQWIPPTKNLIWIIGVNHLRKEREKFQRMGWVAHNPRTSIHVTTQRQLEYNLECKSRTPCRIYPKQWWGNLNDFRNNYIVLTADTQS